MTSFAKAESNRLNAKRSTGPTSLRGRRRSSQNACKHGLNTASDPAFCQQCSVLAEQLSVLFPNADRSILLRISEAHVSLVRVRYLKFALLKNKRKPLAANDGDMNRSDVDERTQGSLLFARYEQRALSRRNSAMRELTDSELNSRVSRTGLAERSQKAE